ncbi:MAG: HD domain-containing protein [Planctomycetes bacterium]|nr:HD domain-containing protein [Planctomycetota bacterium]
MLLQPVSRLPLGVPLGGHLLHRSGARLHGPADILTKRHVALMERAGMDEVALLGPLDRLARFEAELRTRDVHVQGLKRGEKLARAVYDVQDRLILDAGQVIDDAAIGALMAHGIAQVRVAKSANELALDQVNTYRNLVRRHVESDEPLGEIGGSKGVDSLRSHVRGLMRAQALAGQATVLALPRDGPPPEEAVPTGAAEERAALARQLHAALVANVNAMLGCAAIHEALTQDDVRVVCELCTRAFAFARPELCAAALQATSESASRATHTVHVMVLSLAQARGMNLPAAGTALLLQGALLHDFGMERVPAVTLAKPGRLTPDEMAEVRRHVTYGLEIADSVEGLDPAVALAIYHSHEEPSGRGYPQGLKTEQTHEAGRLLRTSALFSALNAPRPYRKAMLPFRAMEELLKQSAAGHCDAGAARALVRGIGAYPIGSWVELEDGSQACVQDCAPELPSQPRVLVHAIADVPVEPPRALDCANPGSPQVRRACARPRGLAVVAAP